MLLLSLSLLSVRIVSAGVATEVNSAIDVSDVTNVPALATAITTDAGTLTLPTLLPPSLMVLLPLSLLMLLPLPALLLLLLLFLLLRLMASILLLLLLQLLRLSILDWILKPFHFASPPF